MKTALRIVLVAAAALIIFIVDRTGWPIYVMLAVWVVLLVLGALLAERRGYPKPLSDLMIFSLLAATTATLGLLLVNFAWNKDFLHAAVFFVFIFILVKAAIDFLDRPLPGMTKTSVVLPTAARPLTEPRHEIG